MPNNNLVPVTITDKNGKKTTVHRRVKPEPSLRKGLPAPVRDPYMSEERKVKLAERQALRDKIVELVGDSSTTGPTNPKSLAREVSVINGTEHLQRALAVAEAIKDNPKPDHQKGYELWKFAEIIRTRKQIDIAYDNIELVRKSTNMTDGFGAVLLMHETLSAKAATDDDLEPKIPNMEQHIYAHNALKPHNFYGDSTHVLHYANKFAPLISEHPERTEQICDYLIERGGLNGFNEDGFNEYLNTHSSLAAGTL